MYDNLGTNTTYILVINEALYYGNNIDHYLVNPNQVRAYWIYFWDNPFDWQKGLTIAINDEVTIPMQAMGTKNLYKTRMPTELEMSTCQYIAMTSPQAWEPSQVNLIKTQQEQKAEPPFCQISQTTAKARYEYIYPKTDQALLHYT